VFLKIESILVFILCSGWTNDWSILISEIVVLAISDRTESFIFSNGILFKSLLINESMEVTI
jgi:hypothetical protein